eukprot:jgi/Undpi1/2378/HiC_scaffold_13.g05759.m1
MITSLRKSSIVSVLAFKLATAADTPSPNQPIPKTECDASVDVSMRYSPGSERLYLESADGTTRGGCVTLSKIWEEQDEDEETLYAVDPETGDVSDTVTGTWLLKEDLYVEDGITLEVELTFLSHATIANRTAPLQHFQVFAWDTYNNKVKDDEDDGRSYISAVSEVITDESEDCDGRASTEMGEARMDIEDSEMAYLGYHATESYGLTWKVRGFCKDMSNLDLFDNVNVYGNIYNSHIHHNNFGVYTYGHQQGDWRNNTIHDNSGYGFDPHDDSDFLTIHDNTVYDNGYHGIIASKRCNGVSIQVRSRLASRCWYSRAAVQRHTRRKSAFFFFLSSHSFNADVSSNIFADNKHGVRFSVGCANNVYSNNFITGSTEYSIYSYLGSDEPEVSDSRRSYDNVFQENVIIAGEQSIKIKETDGTRFIDNTFWDAREIRFDDATGTVISGNTGLDGAELQVANGACFDHSSNDGGEEFGYKPIC